MSLHPPPSHTLLWSPFSLLPQHCAIFPALSRPSIKPGVLSSKPLNPKTRLTMEANAELDTSNVPFSSPGSGSPPADNGTGTGSGTGTPRRRRYGPARRGRAGAPAEDEKKPFGQAPPTDKITVLVENYQSAAQGFVVQNVEAIPEFPDLWQSMVNVVGSISGRNSTLRLNEVSVFDKAIVHLYREVDDKIAALMLFAAEYAGIVQAEDPFKRCRAAALKLVQTGVLKGLNPRIPMPSRLTDITQQMQRLSPLSLTFLPRQ